MKWIGKMLSGKGIPPKYLYRYEKDNIKKELIKGKYGSHSEENLAKHQFYFSSVWGLNDPFDSKLFKVKEPTSKEFTGIIDEIINYSHTSELNKEKIKKIKSELERIKDIFDKGMQEPIVKVGKEILKYFGYKYINKRGIVCFSDSRMKEDKHKNSIKHNILMWSHYANNHKGFCLEFNTKNEYKPLSKGLTKIEYQKDLPTIDLHNLVTSDVITKVEEFKKI